MKLRKRILKDRRNHNLLFTNLQGVTNTYAICMNPACTHLYAMNPKLLSLTPLFTQHLHGLPNSSSFKISPRKPLRAESKKWAPNHPSRHIWLENWLLLA